MGLVIRWAWGRPSEGGGGELPDQPALLFVQRGVWALHGHGQRLWADPTQIVLLPAGGRQRAEHRGCEGGGQATLVALTLEGYREVLGATGLSDAGLRQLFSHRVILRPPGVQQKLHLLEVASLCREESPGPDVDERFLDLFLEVVSTAESSRATKRQWSAPAQVVRLVLADLLEDSPSLQALASEAGCTRSHLCRVFKNETGITINQYLHRLRLSQAIPRLLAGEDDLSKLAFSLGYSSHSHFTNRFRRFFGVTPSAFRKQAQLLDVASSAGAKAR